MLPNPPPERCDGCGRVAGVPLGGGLAAGDPEAWVMLEGPDVTVVLEGGREVSRRGRGWVCRRCGHTVPASQEFVR